MAQAIERRPTQVVSIRVDNALWTILSIGLFVGIWWLVTDGIHVANPLLLPSPAAVLSSVVNLSKGPNIFNGGLYGGNLEGNVLISLGRVLLGFTISVIAGVIFGTMVGVSKTLDGLADPLLQLGRQIPPISYIPLALIWFGLSENSIIFIIVAGAFWPIFLNTAAGIRATPRAPIRAALALGCTTWQLITRVLLPSALPQIVTGCRVSFGLAWSAVVAAELIGSSAGIGYLVMHARLIIATPDVIAGMVAIGIIGFVCDAIFVALERRIFAYRRP